MHGTSFEFYFFNNKNEPYHHNPVYLLQTVHFYNNSVTAISENRIINSLLIN